MQKVCILTDSIAQFPRSLERRRKVVKILPPSFALESDRPILYQKVRNAKQLANLLIEYTREFGNIAYIGLHFGLLVENAEGKAPQDRLRSLLPQHLIEAQF